MAHKQLKRSEKIVTQKMCDALDFGNIHNEHALKSLYDANLNKTKGTLVQERE